MSPFARHDSRERLHSEEKYRARRSHSALHRDRLRKKPRWPWTGSANLASRADQFRATADSGCSNNASFITEIKRLGSMIMLP
jgi:hypothetical protein